MQIEKKKGTYVVTFDSDLELAYTCGFTHVLRWNDLPVDVLRRLIESGPQAKLGDAGGSGTDAAKRERRAALVERFYSGEWREGGGGSPNSPYDLELDRMLENRSLHAIFGGKVGKCRDALKADRNAVIWQLVARLVCKEHGRAFEHADSLQDQIRERLPKYIAHLDALVKRNLAEAAADSDVQVVK